MPFHVRFSHAAFLSGFSPTNPGGDSAGFSPTNPGGHHAGWSPTNPGGDRAGWSPTNPGGDRAGWSPTNPPRPSGSSAAPMPTTAPAPWEGVDAAWTYADPQALRAQALRKSRLKITRRADGRGLIGPSAAASPRPGNPLQPCDPRDKLWRWGPAFRVSTVAGELAARLPVYGTALWHVQEADGKVQAPRQVFHIDPAALHDLDWDLQVDKVLRAAVEREDRLPEILTQASDFWAFFESVTGLDLGQARGVAELLTACDEWGLQVLMLLKHRLAVARPHQRSSLVMPVIPTPGHGAVPSGHATVAAFKARLLTHLLGGPDGPLPSTRVEVLDRLARRIAFNRVVAGVHHPVDGLVGYHLGRAMADAVAVLAGAPGVAPAPEPDWGALLEDPTLPEDDGPPPLAPPEPKRSGQWTASDILRRMWCHARVEIDLQRV